MLSGPEHRADTGFLFLLALKPEACSISTFKEISLGREEGWCAAWHHP